MPSPQQASTDPGAAQHLAPWAYRTLAMLAGAIGIAASVVTARFFVAGLLQLEADAPARDALIAAGMLMIATELGAFFLAALLPAKRLRALRVQLLVCAGLLLAFECATIYLTQRALNGAAEAQQASLQTRISQQQASIEANRKTATALRENGTAQSASRYSWVRQDGAAILQRADEIEQRTEKLANELANLQMQQRTTVAVALGHTGMLAYSVARSVLVSGMGLVMCGAAGALLRSARQASTAPLQPAAPEIATALQPDLAVATTVAPTVAPPVAPPVAPSDEAAEPVAPPPDPPAPDVDGDERYRQLLEGVQRGDIAPSVRAIHAAVGGSTLSIRAYQQRLMEDGVIEKRGQGYRLRPPTG